MKTVDIIFAQIAAEDAFILVDIPCIRIYSTRFGISPFKCNSLAKRKKRFNISCTIRIAAEDDIFSLIIYFKDLRKKSLPRS